MVSTAQTIYRADAAVPSAEGIVETHGMNDAPLAAQDVLALLEAMDKREECLGCLYWLRDHLEELEVRVDKFAAQIRLKQPGGSILPK